jgi:spore maturation protein CgeB
MHFVVFGLCISSSWGNGHATLWRGLVKALVCRGHTLSFYEKDVPYLPPPLHPAFFCSARATLNVTRHAMAQYGFCPSGRLFEAAACGAPILSDWWEGLDRFFELGKEILPVCSTDDVLAALSLSDGELREVAAAARTEEPRESYRCAKSARAGSHL